MATPYPLALRHFPALRQSTLARFADCQLSAGFELSLALVKPGEYLHRSGWTTARQAAGRIIHATLARALRHMVERGEERIPVEVVLDLYDDELRQAYPSVQSVTLREFYIRRSKPREATLWRHELPHLLAYLGSMAERFDRCYTEAMLTPRGRARRRPLTTPAQWGEPSPGAHCSYCPKALDCPLDRDAREGGAITTPQEAVRFAGALLVAKRAAKQVERSIRTWNDREGPVRVRDGKRDRFFGFVESERVERPTRRAVEEAMLAGRSPLDLFKRKVSTRFTDYSPDQDVTVGLDENDVVEMFERAAEEAQRRRTRRGRRRTTA
jgi:hypothetical protein